MSFVDKGFSFVSFVSFVDKGFSFVSFVSFVDKSFSFVSFVDKGFSFVSFVSFVDKGFSFVSFVSFVDKGFPRFNQILHRLGVLDQGRHLVLGLALDLRADLADLGQRVREHLADGIFQHPGVGRHADVGVGRRRQEEAARIYVLRANAAVPGCVAFVGAARHL